MAYMLSLDNEDVVLTWVMSHNLLPTFTTPNLHMATSLLEMSLQFQACALSSPLKSRTASVDTHCPGVPNRKKTSCTIDQHCDIIT